MAEREAILLVRLDGIGDAALCIPALEGLHRAFPTAAFGAVCSPANSSLFSNKVERIHVYDAAAPVAAMREELGTAGYTKALVATEEVAGYQIARLSRARERAGFWHRLHKPFKSLWQLRQVTSAVYRPAAHAKLPEHEVQTIFRLAVALGAREPAPQDEPDLRSWLRVEPSDEARAARGAVGFQITPKLVAGGFGPADLAAAIGETLNALGGMRGVLIAAAADENLACAILEHVPAGQRQGDLLSLAAGLNLPKWLGVLDAVETLVTPDTGAAHVAGMLGGRVVDIFDAPDYARLCAQWHPWAGSWRCHAKQAKDMNPDAAVYGRFLAQEIRALDTAPAPRASAPNPGR